MKLCIVLIIHKLKWNLFFVCVFLNQDVKPMSVATIIPSDIKDIMQRSSINDVKDILNGTRRIINGEESRNTRPYMVYLKLPNNHAKYKNYRRWLCAGVIIHEEYILTSAACIEDAKHFYVVSGTYKHNEDDDRNNNLCIKNGAKKAVWKCVPQNYIFDGHENDNLRWMNNDIAIVKVEDEFDFTRRIRGCDFAPKPIRYNNESSKYENAGNMATIAGWGTTEKYNDLLRKRSDPTNQELLETSVLLISKQHCKQRWGPRYHKIIDNYMICSQDIIAELSEPCKEKYIECTDIRYSDEEEPRRVLNPNQLFLHSSHHNVSRRVTYQGGGFCENDHGGPLIYQKGPEAIVIGIISACLVKEKTNKCYGPFLYTSVYKNRVLINCAIYRDINGCSRLLRSSDSYIEEDITWFDHPDGPSKAEKIKRRKLENMKYNDESIDIANSSTLH